MPDVQFSLGNQWFVYDSNKEAVNKQKHGISFTTAAYVFLDRFRLDFRMNCTARLMRNVG